MHSQGNNKQAEKTEWEKITANETTDKELISKIYKQLMNFNTKKTTQSKVDRSLRSFSKEDMQMAKKHMKNAQKHSLLEKCKSKLQWDITLHQSEWPSSKSL